MFLSSTACCLLHSYLSKSAGHGISLFTHLRCDARPPSYASPLKEGREEKSRLRVPERFKKVSPRNCTERGSGKSSREMSAFFRLFFEQNASPTDCCLYLLRTIPTGVQIGFELHSDERRCESKFLRLLRESEQRSGWIVLCTHLLVPTDACGGRIDSSNGSITSPSFPELYPANKNCVWEILAPPQWRITVNFTHFDIEGNNVSASGEKIKWERVLFKAARHRA